MWVHRDDSEHDSRKDGQRFPESGTNNDNRGLPGFKDIRPLPALDDRIHHVVTDQLNADSIVDDSDIKVEVKNGEVRLTGSVPAQALERTTEILNRIPGIVRIDNKLIARPEQEQETD